MRLKRVISKTLSASLLSIAIAIASTHQAYAADVNLVFVVDESGSMSGEHAWLPDFTSQLETDLQDIVGLSSSFGLVGYGNSAIAPRPFTVGSGQFGNASDFASATSGLVVNGGTEDGYAGIQYALDNLTFDPGARVAIILVTDEDRDIYDSNLDYNSILTALQDKGATLTGILNQPMSSGNNDAAIGTDGTDTYIADGSGGFTTAAGVIFPPQSSYDTTTDDYTNLAIAAQGCVADLNLLRAGGTDAQSFSAAFLNCLSNVIQSQPGNGGMQQLQLSSRTLPRIISYNRQTGIFQLQNINQRLNSRRSGTVVQIDLDKLKIEQNGQMVSYREILEEQGITDINGAAAGEGQPSALARGLFIEGRMDKGSFDASNNSVGSDFDTNGLTVGFDYRFTPELLAGVALGYTNNNTEQDGNQGETDTEATSLFAYGTFYPTENIFIDGLVGYSWTNHGISRNFGGNTMKAKTDSTTQHLMVKGGYNFIASDSLMLTPSLAANYEKIDVDGYTETGVTPLTVGDDQAESVRLTLGGELVKYLQIKQKDVELNASLAFVHEFADDSRSVAVNFVGGSSVLNMDISELDQEYMTLGLGTSVMLSDSSKLSLRYSTYLDNSDVENHSLAAQFRYEF
ncbi:outer membrane autotransporter barrel domain-containing protein [Amphritea atlantica]|uniref:Outer membrane autotransporter barrel domain-containing protein n=1 Tax=Amphritea atlantica TaxID=355243 RepID=A0A1H9IYE5_9GAMM|nr:autotransporter outer membrane beta-barrel domain-containing protein [Amphritea atlantica]SEQ79821.1 outer membrane autotransporter barrel domain-containing protein [Amphritea atlantica]